MFVVIFRAKVLRFDEDYSRVAERMRDLATLRFGCLEFHAVTEGEPEVALAYWPDEESIRAWRNPPEHVLAQQAGRDRWYESYSVQVAEITREYRVPRR